MTDDLFLVRPSLEFHLMGTSIRLDPSKAYWAVDATNQPDWRKGRKVFLLCTPSGEPRSLENARHDGPSFLMTDGDYERVEGGL
jgi:hypothetical protein